MTDGSRKQVDNRLRKNIWRSLLILKSASLAQLPAVVTGLTVRRARALMHDLERHGYVAKELRQGRHFYSQAVDQPALPQVCHKCGRGFESKDCSTRQLNTQVHPSRPLGAIQRKRQLLRETSALLLDTLRGGEA